jgi:formylglycine-generating enzyme required for sulfatase activity
VLGTVPVHEDGSARFLIPAYTPISLQPLDAEGKAVQLMRSWMTAMPGEVVSCAGCHEKQNSAPPVTLSIASAHPPAQIRPWHGPVRGFDFRREVQPVLDRYCVGCHDGQPRPDGPALCDFTAGPPRRILDNTSSINAASRFSPSYYQLRRFVRTPTKESDMYVPLPWEFHADTTRLVQMLQKGHHDVRLDDESWDRLITWIDLNAPFHGSWADIRGSEIGEHVRRQCQRRNEMRAQYAGMSEELAAAPPAPTVEPIVPPPRPARKTIEVACADWPFNAEEAVRRQRGSGLEPAELTVELAEGVRLDLVPVPAGEFVMGQEDGCDDERPSSPVKIAKPFWIGRCEVTNAQFAAFDPRHDSRMEPGDFIHFSPGERGWPLSRPAQPVVRVSWHQALAFCRWLSEKTGRHFHLPTEAQWEYACRAGTATPLSYGETSRDFSTWANLSDARHAAIDPFGWVGRVQTLPAWRPAETHRDDGQRVSAPVSSYSPNAWGLCDMHGNVAEWTRSAYRPYPYRDRDGRNDLAARGKRVVRGGSWYDRPKRCRSAFRQAYPADQPVYDVGFRVVCAPAPGNGTPLAHWSER